MRNNDPDAEPNRCEWCLKLCAWRFCSDTCRDKQEDFDREKFKANKTCKKGRIG